MHMSVLTAFPHVDAGGCGKYSAMIIRINEASYLNTKVHQAGDFIGFSGATLLDRIGKSFLIRYDDDSEGHRDESPESGSLYALVLCLVDTRSSHFSRELDIGSHRGERVRDVESN